MRAAAPRREGRRQAACGTAPGAAIVSPHTADRMMAMFRSVVVEGTGTEAAIPGYTVAGKTGTAEKAENGVYVIEVRRLVRRARAGAEAAARDPRDGRRAARADLRRRRRGARFPRHRALRAPVPRGPAGRARDEAVVHAPCSLGDAVARQHGNEVARREADAVGSASPQAGIERQDAASAESCFAQTRPMQLDALIRALAPERGDRAPAARDLRPRPRHALREARHPLLLHPGREPRRARPRSRGASRTAPSRSSSSERSTSPCPSSSSSRRARRWRWRQTRSSASRPSSSTSPASPGRTGRRRPRSSCARSSRRRAPTGPRRDGRVGRRRASAGPAPHTTPEAIDLQRLFREMVDAGDQSGRARGVVARLALPPPRPGPLRRARLHEPDPGPPRPARRHGGVLPGEAPALHGHRAAARRGERRRPVRAPPRRRACRRAPRAARHVRAPARGGGPRRRPRARRRTAPGSPRPASPLETRCSASSTSRTSSAPSPPGSCSTSTRRRSPPACGLVTGVPGRFEAIDEGQPFAVVVDYSHKPDALDAVLQAARDARRRAGDRRLRRGRRPRPREATRDGTRRAASAPTSSIVTNDNPRSRGPARDHRRRSCWAQAPTSRSTPTGARRSSRAIGRREAGRRRRDRGQGPRAGTGDRRRRASVRRPRGRAGGAPRQLSARRVIPLEWGELEAARRSASCAARPADGVVRRVHDDSRDARPGDLFVALNTGARFVEDALERGAATLVPADQEAALATLAGLVRDRSDAAGRRGRRLDGQDDDEGRARRALRRRDADRGGGREPEQRARPAADRAAARAGDPGARHRDGDARARTDRGAVPGRPADRRARHVDRPRAPRARREPSRTSRARTPRRSTRSRTAGSPSSRRTSRSSSRTSGRRSTSAASTPPPSGARTAPGATSVGGTELVLELPFTQRHLAENVLAALTAYDALGLPLGRAVEGARSIALSRWRGEVVRASRRRARRQRRVQREPDVDAGRAA